jgi:hypothetical protein
MSYGQLPEPRPVMRLIVEIDRTPDGRIEGSIRAETAKPWQPFSGVLELLKVLEDVLDPAEQALTPAVDMRETT